MSDSCKLLSLARLAADERTPEHERAAAARELAKRVARGELPTRTVFSIDPAAEVSSSTARKMAAMEAILAQNATELHGLRADKAELEARCAGQLKEIERLRAGGYKPFYMTMPKGGF